MSLKGFSHSPKIMASISQLAFNINLMSLDVTHFIHPDFCNMYHRDVLTIITSNLPVCRVAGGILG